MRTGCFLVIGLVFSLSIALATPYQDMNPIKQGVREFVKNQLGTQSLGKAVIDIGYLDNRLQLPACTPEKLSFSLPPNTEAIRATAIAVNCHEATQWRIYVPVRVTMVADVIVAAKNLAKGTVLEMGDLKTQTVDITQLKQGFFQSPENMLQKVLKTPVSMGVPISPDSLVSQQVVSRGEFVQVMAQSGKISVSVTGMAMASGGIGDLIKVQNLKSKRMIDVKVIGPKQVEVPFYSF